MASPEGKPDLDRIAPGGAVIRRARLRAGISQQELAARLHTSQSLIARWENGVVEPGYSTVIRAVRACGLELECRIATYDHEHDLLIQQNLRLSPKERLRSTQQGAAAMKRLRDSVR